jgi:methylmalonyl-CoA mutase N-terminal domain/subunit
MRQFSGFATAEETNRRYKYLLANGQTGLSVAFDMPTLMGQDSDAPTSRGEIGHCGVAIDSLADMETLFAGIPLGEITTSMTINSPAAILLCMYIAVAEERLRSSPSPSPTAWRMSTHVSNAGCASTTSHRGFRSSSTPT